MLESSVVESGESPFLGNESWSAQWIEGEGDFCRRTLRLHAPRLGRSTSLRRRTRIRGPAHASPSARPCASWRRRRGRKDFSPTLLKPFGTSPNAHLLRWIVKGTADERRSHLQGGGTFHRPHRDLPATSSNIHLLRWIIRGTAGGAVLPAGRRPCMRAGCRGRKPTASNSEGSPAA